MLLRQGAVERDARAERLDGLVAQVGKSRIRREADPCSLSAEGQVRRMAESQRSGQVEARARIYRRLAVKVRLRKGRRKVDAGTRRTPRQQR